MRTILSLALTIVFLLPCAAFAQHVTYSSDEFDFSIALPGGGLIGDAFSDPDWEEDETTVLRWVGLVEGAPITVMMVNAVTLEHEVSDDDVFAFMEGMVEGSQDPENNMSLRDVSDVFTVGNRGWISALIDDTSVDATGQYEIFVTRQGQWIYAVTFYYADGAAGQELAGDILGTFVTSGG
jgi:hypothetical protein